MQNDCLLDEVEKINAYYEEYKFINIICIVRLIVYLILLPFFCVFGGPFIWIYILSFLIWWLITANSKSKYREKMFETAKNKSFIICDKCKKYKYADKTCSCGNDNKLSREDIESLLKTYKRKMKTVSKICTTLTTIIVVAEFFIIAIYLIMPYTIETNYSTVFLVNVLGSGVFIGISIIVTAVLLYLIFYTLSCVIGNYTTKINMLDDGSCSID